MSNSKDNDVAQVDEAIRALVGHCHEMEPYADKVRSTLTAQRQTISTLTSRCEALEAALGELVYFNRGEWYTGIHGDAYVTDIVGGLLNEATKLEQETGQYD